MTKQEINIDEKMSDAVCSKRAYLPKLVISGELATHYIEALKFTEIMTSQYDDDIIAAFFDLTQNILHLTIEIIEETDNTLMKNLAKQASTTTWILQKAKQQAKEILNTIKMTDLTKENLEIKGEDYFSLACLGFHLPIAYFNIVHNIMCNSAVSPEFLKVATQRLTFFTSLLFENYRELFQSVEAYQIEYNINNPISTPTVH